MKHLKVAFANFYTMKESKLILKIHFLNNHRKIIAYLQAQILKVQIYRIPKKKTYGNIW